MKHPVRIGLWTAGGILLGVLLFAGLVWRAEGVTITRAIKCSADNDGESIAFACTARERVRAK